MNSPFYLELLDSAVNSYELKKFRVQHDETQLTDYLCKTARKHQQENLNKTYLVRLKDNDSLVGWFSLKAATLPYNDKDEVFLTPAIEMSHFAIDTPKLIDYYKTRLCFHELKDIEEKNFFEYAVPDYDEGCKFMYFPLNS